MNTEALEWWFEEHDIQHHYNSDKDSFVLVNINAIDNDTLGEIAACGGHISKNDTFNGFNVYGDYE